MKSAFESLKYGVKTENAGLKTRIAHLRFEIANMRTDVQTSIDKNMQWSIGLIAFIVTALKIVDTVV